MLGGRIFKERVAPGITRYDELKDSDLMATIKFLEHRTQYVDGEEEQLAMQSEIRDAWMAFVGRRGFKLVGSEESAQRREAEAEAG